MSLFYNYFKGKNVLKKHKKTTKKGGWTKMNMFFSSFWRKMTLFWFSEKHKFKRYPSSNWKFLNFHFGHFLHFLTQKNTKKHFCQKNNKNEQKKMSFLPKFWCLEKFFVKKCTVTIDCIVKNGKKNAFFCEKFFL